MKDTRRILLVFYLSTILLFGFYLASLSIFFQEDSPLKSSLTALWEWFGVGVGFYLKFLFFYFLIFLGTYIVVFLIKRNSPTPTQKPQKDSTDPHHSTNAKIPVSMKAKIEMDSKDSVPSTSSKKIPTYYFLLLILIMMGTSVYIVFNAKLSEPSNDSPDSSVTPYESPLTSPNQDGIVTNAPSLSQQLEQYIFAGIGAILGFVLLYFLYVRLKDGRKSSMYEKEEWKIPYLQKMASILEECYQIASDHKDPDECCLQVKQRLSYRLKEVDESYSHSYATSQLIVLYFFQWLSYPKSLLTQLIETLEFDAPLLRGRTEKTRKYLLNILVELDQITQSYLKLLVKKS